MREIISVGVGSFGVRMADPLWDQLLKDQCLDDEAKPMENKSDEDIGNRNVFFHEEKNSERFIPRTVLYDCEDIPMKDIMKSKGNILYNNQFIHGKQSANHNVRATYTVGRDIVDFAQDAVRHQIEKCDHIGTIIFQNCFTGASGSGLLQNIKHRIHLFGSKIDFVCTSLMPCPNFQNGTVQPYDSLLGISDSNNCYARQMMICLDNEKLYNLAEKKADIENPSFADINKIVATLISKLTIRQRFNNGMNGSLSDLYSSLVPFKNVNYLTPCLSTILEDDTISYPQTNESSIIQSSLSGESSLNSNLFSDGKYSSLSFLVEGLPGPTFKHKIVSQMQTSSLDLKKHLKNIYFQQNVRPNFSLKQKTQIFQLSNHTSIKKTFQRVVRRFDIEYAKRSFVHWYVGEGLSEGFFEEARQNLRYLIRSYEQLQAQNIEAQEEQ